MTTSIVPSKSSAVIKAAPLPLRRQKRQRDKLYGAGTLVQKAVAEYHYNDEGKLQQVPTEITALQMYVTDVDFKPLGTGSNYQEKLNVWGNNVVVDENGEVQRGDEVWCYTAGLQTVPARTIVGALLIHDKDNPISLEFELCKAQFFYVSAYCFDGLTGNSLVNEEHKAKLKAAAAQHVCPDGADKYERARIKDLIDAEYIAINKEAIEQIIFPNA